MRKLFFVIVLTNALILSLGHRRGMGDHSGGCTCHKKHNEDSETDLENTKSNRRICKATPESESDSESENSTEIESENTTQIESDTVYDNESDKELEINSDSESENKSDYENEVGEDASKSGVEDETTNEQETTIRISRRRLTEIEEDVDCAQAFNQFREGVLRASIRFLKSYEDSIKGETGAMSPLATLFSVGALALFSYGQTKVELYSLLNIASRDDIECVFKTINEIVENLPDTVDFNLATNYYGNVNYRFTKSFKAALTDLVVGVADTVNFTRSALAMNIINKKIDSQTNNKIKSVIEGRDVINRTTELVAVSAFYFSSNWEIEFETSDKVADFRIDQRKQLPTDFMYQQAVYNYTHCPFLNAKVLQLNLKDKFFDVLVILPDLPFNEKVVIEKMYKNPTKWYNLLQKSMQPKKVAVYLPAFNLNSWVDSRALLMESTDLETIYSGDSMRLKGVLRGNKDVGVSVGRQRVYIELPYEGGPVQKLPRKGTTVNFRANYPFIFFIFLRGIVIFAGVYRSPST